MYTGTKPGWGLCYTWEEDEPDGRVLSVLDTRVQLGEDRLHPGVDYDQLSQSVCSLQPDGAVGVVKGLDEGRLELR